MNGDSQYFNPAGWLAARGQSWIDARLAESTAARQSLEPIEGRRFELMLEGPDVCIGLRVGDGRLILESPGRGEPDARLSATPLDALKLARSQSLSNLKKTDASLEGNIHVAEAFARTLALLSPDPEAELAGWVGDIAAHEIVSAARAVQALVAKAERSFEQDMAEFFREEQPALARPREVEEFVEEVDDIRDAVERAATRLEKLTRARRGSGSGRRPHPTGTGTAATEPPAGA